MKRYLAICMVAEVTGGCRVSYRCAEHNWSHAQSPCLYCTIELVKALAEPRQASIPPFSMDYLKQFDDDGVGVCCAFDEAPPTGDNNE